MRKSLTANTLAILTGTIAIPLVIVPAEDPSPPKSRQEMDAVYRRIVKK